MPSTGPDAGSPYWYAGTAVTATHCMRLTLGTTKCRRTVVSALRPVNTRGLTLLSDLHSESAWLTRIRAELLRGDVLAAEASLVHALVDFPCSRDLRRIHAQALQQSGRSGEAIALLQTLLDGDSGDTATAFALAHIFIEQSRVAAAAKIMLTCFSSESNRGDVDLAINAIELLDGADCKTGAAAIAAGALGAKPSDARLQAYAGMLQVQLGNFERARQHYLMALDHDERAWEWHVPIGLSATQQYPDVAHSDFALFKTGLERRNLSDLARAELHFALGKAHDDVGGYATAAAHFRQGNTIGCRLSSWSQKTWRRVVDAELGRVPTAHSTALTPGFTPIFIVGMPRTGTTLLATQLTRFSAVCNRGELPWLARLAQRPGLDGVREPAALQAVAREYAQRSRQDDAENFSWFIDKQPLNFCFLDLALAMFPDARVIHCVRGARDTALSLWTQCFLHRVHGYSYTFDDMALVMRDEQRLMVHCQRYHPCAVRTVRYEDLVSDPRDIVTGLGRWLGVTASSADGMPPDAAATSISTASTWQARQSIHRHSIGRWRHYLRHVPELLQFPE